MNLFKGNFSTYFVKWKDGNHPKNVIFLKFCRFAISKDLKESLIWDISFFGRSLVEYEFIPKNQFHNWTSKLACIWHVFRKLGYFWLFLSTPAQVTFGEKTKYVSWKKSQKEPNFTKILLSHSWLLRNIHRE